MQALDDGHKVAQILHSKDFQKKGLLSQMAFLRVLKDTGMFQHIGETCQVLLKRFDTHMSGKVNYLEFIRFCEGDAVGLQQDDTRLTDVIRRLRHRFAELSEKQLGQDDHHTVFLVADKEGRGFVTRNEFRDGS